MYFVQIHTSCYIKVPNFVLNTWVPHYQIDQKLRFITKVEAHSVPSNVVPVVMIHIKIKFIYSEKATKFCVIFT